jgi:hypothetical protein
MTTIKTKFLAPTDYRGDRIGVTIDGQRKEYGYNYAFSSTENHFQAIWKALAELKGPSKKHRFQYEFNHAWRNGHVDSTSTGYEAILA